MKDYTLVKHAESMADHGVILEKTAKNCTCANCGKAHAKGVNQQGSVRGLFVVGYTHEGTAYACSESCKDAIYDSRKPLWEHELAKQRNSR